MYIETTIRKKQPVMILVYK